jgi:putative hydrolase of the HAD superfamily
MTTADPFVLDGVCFDLYSTLVHEVPGNPFYPELAEALGLDLDYWMPAYRKRHRETMAGLIPGMVERVRLSIEDIGVRCSEEIVRAAVERSFPGFVESIKLDPATEPLLAGLRENGVALGLVTNASDHSERIFDQLGLRKYFDVTVFSYRVKLLKPAPQIYRYALDGLGLPAGRCAFVGDGGDNELQGARHVGFTTILVDRPLPHCVHARADADAVVSDLAEVPDALDSLGDRRQRVVPHSRKRGEYVQSAAARH